MRTYIFIFATACIAALTACNDKVSNPDIESSSSDKASNHSWIPVQSSEQDSPEWSSSAMPSLAMSSSTIPAYSSSEYLLLALSSSAELQVGSSSSIEESSSSAIMDTSPEIVLDKDGFATVADVYKSLAPDEKAVFIIRHSEREDDVALETELTANGIQMARDLGATLKSEEEFSYVTSGFVRTNETANQISKGRGEATSPKLITNYDITGNWFLKISADSLAKQATALGLKGSSIELMARWAYEGGYPETFYEMEPRAQEFMQAVILKNLSKWKRITIMVSHDIFVMPLAVFGSQKKVALKYHEDYHWINFIAGLAVIADAQNNLRYIPVKGADSGVIDYLALYMAEHKIYTK
ncbi:histidine phosphatase family protein [Fibrobacter sp. UWOV1]|uniref:histidine phosphatase family protein n=1 Tax=Fibrobacter sp. UWOV1 TaxID=1896215 RepID=UPI0009F95883|nr:histidine phosphatase family protein [Fibrobacter sp. UWOV1]